MLPSVADLHDPHRPTASFITLCIVAAILGQAVQNLSVPMWFASMDPVHYPHRDAFCLMLVISCWYPVLFFVSALVARIAGGRPPLGFIHNYRSDQHITLCLTGLSNALCGVLIITASPSERTPAIVASLIGATTLLPMIIIKHFYFSVPHLRPYKDRMFVIMMTAYLCATYTIIYPMLARNEGLEGNTQIWWWLAFFIGAIFTQFYNIQQEHSFKLWDKHDTLSDYLEYLLYQTLWGTIWTWSLVWVDMIPGFGSARGAHGLMLAVYETFSASFFSPAVVYNVTFNLAYYASYVAACYINKADALIGTLINVAVPAIVAAISYPIKALTPDKGVVMIGLVPLTIVLFGLATYTYDVWSREKAPYDRPAQERAARKSLSAMSYESLAGSEEAAKENLQAT